jgi:dTDP-4-amino-4,6-dideoxygalactose transaminase
MSVNIPFVKPEAIDVNQLAKDLIKINEAGIYSNFGPFHEKFRNGLRVDLGVNSISLCCNATSGLIAALKILCPHGGEVITTPFTFVGTALAIIEAGFTPVFVDVDKNTFNLDLSLVERAISAETVAILPVHVFGNACDPIGFELLCEQYNIKLIFDAAHSFGCSFGGKSLVSYGDASVVSFHSTKIFHTLEGGAVAFRNPEMSNKFDSIINFGKLKDGSVGADGFNGKMNEVSAAIGLRSLVSFSSVLILRQKSKKQYVELLMNSKFISFQHEIGGLINNSYLPVLIIRDDMSADHVCQEMSKDGIVCTRYFSPSLDELDFKVGKVELGSACKHSKDISKKIICLPIFNSISKNEINRVCSSLLKIVEGNH